MTVWKIGQERIDISRGILMGVINVTPDSFSDGGDHLDTGRAIAAGGQMVSDGATLLDVGGESTRPGASEVSAAEEIDRVIPVVSALAGSGYRVSIDTTKPLVAGAAIEAGATVVNDVSGFRSMEMVKLVAAAGVAAVVMHMRGNPRTMQDDPDYDDVVSEVAGFLAGRAGVLAEAGTLPSSIAIDPGIGFGKTPRHNLELLNRMGEIAGLGYPVVIGTSRKSIFRSITGEGDPKRRDGHTAVSTALAFERGARVFRVHDVRSSRDALRIADAIVAPEAWEEWQLD